MHFRTHFSRKQRNSISRVGLQATLIGRKHPAGSVAAKEMRLATDGGWATSDVHLALGLCAGGEVWAYIEVLLA